MSWPTKNLKGEKFGLWTVLFLAGQDKGRNKMWRCRCECGNEKNVKATSLSLGRTKGCRTCRTWNNHGLRHIKEYGVYRGMIQRTSFCATGSSKRNYFDRGIRTCARWIGEKGFENFIKDMGFRPTSKHQLDRIDNDGNYEPLNCRCATAFQQSKNKRIRIAGRTAVQISAALESVLPTRAN